MRRCIKCPESVNGEPNALSDICDGCQDDSNTGFYGSIDHSIEPDEDQ